MRLSFGTFASILCSGKAYGVTDPKLVGTMTRIVDPNCQYMENAPRVSKLLSCEQNLSDGRIRQTKDGRSETLSNVISKAKSVRKEDVNREFKEKVLPLLSNDKKRQILLALLDLMRDDTTLDLVNKESFEKHLCMSKDALLNKICERENIALVISTKLHEILAGVFLYTVIEVKNTVGKGYEKQVEEYIKRYSSNSETPITNEMIENLPYVRNKYFTGRSHLLEQIHNNLDTIDVDTHAIQVIYGLDGFGKTQLALEFAYVSIISNASNYNAICWIDCSNEDAVKRSCRSFLSKMREVETIDIVSQLSYWLQTHNKWLLILDDANDISLIERLIPKVGSEHILITAQQDKDFLVNNCMRIECMKTEEAIDFLIKCTGIDNQKKAELISERLSCLPLALEQAAAYIKGTGIDYCKFLELLTTYELKLFDNKYSVGSRERTIHTIWEITIDSLSDESKELLYCFSYMSADSIELDWLMEYALKMKNERERGDILIPARDGEAIERMINVSDVFRRFGMKSKFSPELIAALTDELTFLAALSELRKYSLILTKTDYSFTMNSLLQETIRYSISTPTYLISAWEALQARCDNIDLIYEDYRIAFSLSQAESLIRNVYSFLKYREEIKNNLDSNKSYKTDIDMWILEFQLYSFTAQYLMLRGKDEDDVCFYEDADRYYEKSCELAQSLFGGGNDDIVSSSGSFTEIQEKHRRMHVNLLMNRIDTADALYIETRNTLQNSVTINPGMVKKAFENYARLWSKFGFSVAAEEARCLACKCGVEAVT